MDFGKELFLSAIKSLTSLSHNRRGFACNIFSVVLIVASS